MTEETGRKGRLAVIKALKRKLSRKQYDFDDLIKWLMIKHGYNRQGAFRFLGEMEYADLITTNKKTDTKWTVKLRERKKETLRERNVGVSKNSNTSLRAQSSSGNGGKAK